MAQYKGFVFDGINSADYGVVITGASTYSAPERAVEMFDIPGRNGALAIDQGRFANIEITYHCAMADRNQATFAQRLSALRNQLCSRYSYVRLTDDYNADEYRLALYKSGLDADLVIDRGGEFDVVFDCKPQRFLTSGESTYQIGEWGQTITETGDIVTYQGDDLTAVKSLTTDIEPIQDTHGYDSAWIHNDNEQEPYIQRAIAGTVTDLGNYIYDTVVGGTVAWNQIVKNGNFASTASWSITQNYYTSSVANNKLTLTLKESTTSSKNISSPISKKTFIPNHKYLFGITIKRDTESAANVQLNPCGNVFSVGSPVRNVETRIETIRNIPSTSYDGFYIYYVGTGNAKTNDGETVQISNVVIHDLTAMFGSTIADYIYGMEQATAGAGVAWFRNLFPKSYYAYDAGSLQSVNTSEHVLMSKNMLVYPYRQSGVTVNGVTATANSNGTVTVNGTCTAGGSYMWLYGSAATSLMPTLNEGETYIYSLEGAVNGLNGQVIFYGSPSVVHYITGGNDDKTTTFTVPDMSGYNGFAVVLAFVDGFTYNNITVKPMIRPVSISDSAYEPYSATSYPLDSSLTLRGIPKLDSNNKLYYDGDTYESSGKVTRKYSVVDLGTLTWTYGSTTNPPRFMASLPAIGKNDPYWVRNAVLSNAKYTLGTNVGQDGVDGKYGVSTKTAYFTDSAYTDAATFKTAMSGVYLVYELATPTTETATGFTNPQLIDGKTVEQYTDYALSQGTRDMAIPVGHQTDHANICPIYGRTGQTVTVCGKNLFKPLANSATINGITYTVNDDGTITANGTATARSVFVISRYDMTGYKVLPAGTYILNGCPSGYGLGMVVNIWNGSQSFNDVGSGVTFTQPEITSSTIWYVRIDTQSGTTLNNVTISPMIRFASETDSTYEPYTGETITQEFVDGQGNTLTVYGGEHEFVGGVLTVTNAMITYDGSADEAFAYNANYGGFRTAWIDNAGIYGNPKEQLLSNIFVGANGRGTAGGTNLFIMRTYSGTTMADGKYIFFANTGMTDVATFKAWLAENPVQVIYPLATPITYTLTPQQVETLIGTNNVWSDAGRVTVEYGTDPYTMVNDTPFPSKPLIKVTGYGEVGFGDITITITGTAGVVTYIDCDLMECYRMSGGAIVPANQYVTFTGTDFPTIPTGKTRVTSASTISKVEVVPRWWII